MKAVRGMHDLFGAELAAWQKVEAEIKKVFAAFGYKEIRTPALENAEVFTKTVGDDTDIVEKQMYQIVKESETLVLRPEGTAAFMRALVEHQIFRDPNQQRFYYYLPMFRHERPQKGRLRQFHQFGGEFINDPSPESDAEIIALQHAIYSALGISEYVIEINSVGDAECRPVYRDRLQDYFRPRLAELCPQCQKRFERAPMRILDCKGETCKAIAAGAPLITDSLCVHCEKHHTLLQKCLKAAGVPFTNNPKIVRGLDYYNRTAFEFTSNLLGAQSALSGGGRYDGLDTRFGGEGFPAVGFGLGMERIMIALEAKKATPTVSMGAPFYLAALGEAALSALFPLSIELKRAGLENELPYDAEKGLKWHLKNANRIGAKFSVILGENELQNKKVLLKDMQAHTQVEIALSDLKQELLKRLPHA